MLKVVFVSVIAYRCCHGHNGNLILCGIAVNIFFEPISDSDVEGFPSGA